MSDSTSYQYQRPSTMATRSLLSNAADKPSDLNEETTPKPALQRRTTDNYERAAAEASKAGSSLTAQTSIGAGAEDSGSDVASGAVSAAAAAAAAGGSSAGIADRPGLPTRKSWRMSDFKGQQQGQMLAGEPGHGYSTTTK